MVEPAQQLDRAAVEGCRDEAAIFDAASQGFGVRRRARERRDEAAEPLEQHVLALAIAACGFRFASRRGSRPGASAVTVGFGGVGMEIEVVAETRPPSPDGRGPGAGVENTARAKRGPEPVAGRFRDGCFPPRCGGNTHSRRARRFAS
jgi:hypothetical protein